MSDKRTEEEWASGKKLDWPQSKRMPAARWNEQPGDDGKISLLNWEPKLEKDGVNHTHRVSRYFKVQDSMNTSYCASDCTIITIEYMHGFYCKEQQKRKVRLSRLIRMAGEDLAKSKLTKYSPPAVWPTTPLPPSSTDTTAPAPAPSPPTTE